MAVSEKFYSACIRYSDIQSEDRVLIGGGLFGDAHTLATECDFDQFKDFLAAAKGRFDAYDRNKINASIDERGLKAEAELLAAMVSFTQTLPEFFKYGGVETENRQSEYAGAGTRSLSAVFQAGQAMCAEISVLASHYLDSLGFKNSYFGGALYANPKVENNSPHSFVLIPQKGGGIIFDPAKTENPAAPFYSFVDAQDMDAWLTRGRGMRSVLFTKPELAPPDHAPVGYAAAMPTGTYYPEDVINRSGLLSSMP